SIPKGTVWEKLTDWSFFQPMAEMPTIDGLIDAESFGGEWHFRIPDDRGRLHIRWGHGRDTTTSSAGEAIWLTLTARGPIEGGDVVGGMDLGHKTVVWSFANLMSTSANQYWGRK